MGRAFRYQRRMSHIEIALEEKGGTRTAAAHQESGAAPKAGAKSKGKLPAKKPAGKK